MPRLLGAVFLLSFVFAAGCARHESKAPAPALPPAKVRTAQVQTEELPQLTEVTGTVRPVQRAVLAAKVSGAITELRAALGQTVARGELLLKIFSEEAAAQVAQARAQLNLTQRDLERERNLVRQGASTAETVRNLEDRLTGYEAAVREAEAKLSYSEIRAPFDGVIARRWINAGDLASPGQPLLEIEGSSGLEILAQIPHSLAPALEVGASLACATSGEQFSGRLREISSTADVDTRSVEVKMDVPAGARVRSGEFIRILIPGRASRTLLVPTVAVSLNGQMERIFVVGIDGRAVLRIVRTGAIRGDRVEILSGLNGNERIIVSTPTGLREGQPLEVDP
jgi:RND family efflux transporter MFP subunit